MIIDYSEDGMYKAKTPAASSLFETNQYCLNLTEEEAQFFHYLVATLPAYKPLFYDPLDCFHTKNVPQD
jgi:hypothetical protein